MIRKATLDDLPEIMRLGREFLAYSPHRWIALNEDDFAASVAQIIEGAGAIFLSDDGFIGGVLVPCYFNRAVAFLSELFWFARAEGQELLAAFEAWGREAAGGLEVVSCTSGLVDERERAIRRVFARQGYVATEVAFQKRL
jgi:hypothetical protein